MARSTPRCSSSPPLPRVRDPSVIRQLRASLICLVCGIVILGFSRTTADPDLWGHLRFGLDLLATGHVIRPDPYSFLTTGVTWVNHEWLAEAALAVAWTAGASLG